MEAELEHVLMSFYKEGMISFLDSHPECFNEAIELAISDKQPYSWRAAWLLSSCMDENDKRVQPYIKRIIESLTSKKDGHQRELLKILMMMELDDDYEGLMFDKCVTLWESINKKPSVRYSAFKFIIQIAKRHPDLSQEIALLLQEQYLETLSPGIKHSLIKGGF